MNAFKHLNKSYDNVSLYFHSLTLPTSLSLFLFTLPLPFYYFILYFLLIFNDSIYCQFPLSLVFISAFLSQKCDKILVKKNRNKQKEQKFPVKRKNLILQFIVSDILDHLIQQILLLAFYFFLLYSPLNLY